MKLFGSHAKGTATEFSDVDICFFSDSFVRIRSVDIVTNPLKIADKYKSVCIEPRAFPMSEIAQNNPFIREILATGKEIE